MRILLAYPDYSVDPLVYCEPKEGWLCEPLALEYLAAGAQLDGHEVRILDLRLHPHDLESSIREFSPELLGITGFSQHVPRVRELCRQFKALVPQGRTMVGGHHATVMGEDFFRPEVDFVVAGEGVGPFREILRGLECSKLEPVPGVWSRFDGKFHFGGPTVHPPLDSLPLPDRGLNGPDRRHYYMGDMRPIALFRTSLGCVFRCSFCALWKLTQGRVLSREADRVVMELNRITEENIHLVDDEPWLDRHRMERLADAVSQAGIRKKYFTYCRVDTLINQVDLLSKWRGIGLECIYLGIEAVTPHELKQYNKKISVGQIEKALDVARDLGLTVYSLLMIHPGYSRKEFDRLSRFIQRRSVPNPSFSVWTPLPGTDEMPDFRGLTAMDPEGRPDWSCWDLQHPVVPTALPRQEFMERVRRMRKIGFR